MDTAVREKDPPPVPPPVPVETEEERRARKEREKKERAERRALRRKRELERLQQQNRLAVASAAKHLLSPQLPSRKTHKSKSGVSTPVRGSSSASSSSSHDSEREKLRPRSGSLGRTRGSSLPPTPQLQVSPAPSAETTPSSSRRSRATSILGGGKSSSSAAASDDKKPHVHNDATRRYFDDNFINLNRDGEPKLSDRMRRHTRPHHHHRRRSNSCPKERNGKKTKSASLLFPRRSHHHHHRRSLSDDGEDEEETRGRRRRGRDDEEDDGRRAESDGELEVKRNRMNRKMRAMRVAVQRGREQVEAEDSDDEGGEFEFADPADGGRGLLRIGKHTRMRDLTVTYYTFHVNCEVDKLRDTVEGLKKSYVFTQEQQVRQDEEEIRMGGGVDEASVVEEEMIYQRDEDEDSVYSFADTEDMDSLAGDDLESLASLDSERGSDEQLDYAREFGVVVPSSTEMPAPAVVASRWEPDTAADKPLGAAADAKGKARRDSDREERKRPKGRETSLLSQRRKEEIQKKKEELAAIRANKRNRAMALRAQDLSAPPLENGLGTRMGELQPIPEEPSTSNGQVLGPQQEPEFFRPNQPEVLREALERERPATQPVSAEEAHTTAPTSSGEDLGVGALAEARPQPIEHILWEENRKLAEREEKMKEKLRRKKELLKKKQEGEGNREEETNKVAQRLETLQLEVERLKLVQKEIEEAERKRQMEQRIGEERKEAEVRMHQERERKSSQDLEALSQRYEIEQIKQREREQERELAREKQREQQYERENKVQNRLVKVRAEIKLLKDQQSRMQNDFEGWNKPAAKQSPEVKRRKEAKAPKQQHYKGPDMELLQALKNVQQEVEDMKRKKKDKRRNKQDAEMERMRSKQRQFKKEVQRDMKNLQKEIQRLLAQKDNEGEMQKELKSMELEILKLKREQQRRKLDRIDQASIKIVRKEELGGQRSPAREGVEHQISKRDRAVLGELREYLRENNNMMREVKMLLRSEPSPAKPIDARGTGETRRRGHARRKSREAGLDNAYEDVVGSPRSLHKGARDGIEVRVPPVRGKEHSRMARSNSFEEEEIEKYRLLREMEMKKEMAGTWAGGSGRSPSSSSGQLEEVRDRLRVPPQSPSVHQSMAMSSGGRGLALSTSDRPDVSTAARLNLLPVFSPTALTWTVLVWFVMVCFILVFVLVRYQKLLFHATPS